jgi:hypothetical protein
MKAMFWCGALIALASIAAPTAARAQAGPPPVGDLAFVDSGRGALLSRFGATYTLADMRDRGQTHSESVAGNLGLDWIFTFASFGEGSAIIGDIGLNADFGAVLSRTGGDLALNDLAMNLDATIGVGFRQDLAFETYIMGWVGYRFALQGQGLYLEDDLVAKMWHLGYLDATFRWDFLAIEGGVGFGQGGLHFHVGPRLWWFDSVWVGGEVSGWITPPDREVWAFRAFIELRQE